ncbi:unnamed protein product [Zymoseptoria tritici ST99CH_1A5]|uniref:Ribosome biogenesis protein YTM1 n=3 Tax=Zymoseptoria tritici TaxID=1047171 RepID=F9XFP2_ZYMTI|nr:uncharacterized protein MYCGRDRAFT_73948 [Zymoseptoria tritici IPO323]EGP85663.1 hypothetical protein MYCGRDRAFT_73948 [Zymoseptoria tritici IPO323]SMR55266.1 unnamed protein product [Zymoseptoria tritici ST99CH_1E4]SMR57640.1 unnamed protein product [Zymoseptoria tritici ST99CH_3D1]SMY26078.1 unnamed protein product [Zymoseptoria tritici ST99CH_1A5]
MAAQTGARAMQVRIHLKSKDGEIELPEQTGPILVSTELKRYQLSTLVNRLLETERPVPLEFLINGQFLRTSLDEFLTQNGISAEATLNVEYVKALVPPLHVASYEHDDWISSVDVLSSTSKAAEWAKTASPVQSRLLSASFDGSLRIWNMSSEVVATGQWHRGAVHCARFISPTQVASAGMDKSVRIWDFEDAETGTGSLKPKLELVGHKSVTDSLAVHAPSSRILSASADNRIGFWTTKKSEAPAAPEARAPTANKRRKLSGPQISVAQRGPLAMLDSHKQGVKEVCFDENDATVAYSASIDHSVKTWDLTTSRCVDTKTTNQSLMALCHLPEHSLIATGGALRYIDLVDLRASATKVSALHCSGHTNWIRSISRDPSSSYQFITASDDSTCRIWDIRSTSSEAGGGQVSTPVYVIDRASEKGAKQEQGSESTVYSVCWDKEVGVVSGGKDKMLQINQSPA